MSMNHPDLESVFPSGHQRGIWYVPPSIERMMTAVQAVQVEGDTFELVYESGEFEAAVCPEIGDALNLLEITGAVQRQRIHASR